MYCEMSTFNDTCNIFYALDLLFVLENTPLYTSDINGIHQFQNIQIFYHCKKCPNAL